VHAVGVADPFLKTPGLHFLLDNRRVFLYIIKRMTILDKYIKNYAEKTKDQKDSDTALHLKDIIPKTTHLAEKTYKRIIDEIIKTADGAIEERNDR
jgi:hypothetical protein